mmetsp:Transcript_44740/g.103487  ORF Transcript_44740/g.103487 Transcript_44740/m.103487 type:complete len:82 (+) Transcript_44740:258-503(+)
MGLSLLGNGSWGPADTGEGEATGYELLPCLGPCPTSGIDAPLTLNGDEKLCTNGSKRGGVRTSLGVASTVEARGGLALERG